MLTHEKHPNQIESLDHQDASPVKQNYKGTKNNVLLTNNSVIIAYKLAISENSQIKSDSL